MRFFLAIITMVLIAGQALAAVDPAAAVVQLHLDLGAQADVTLDRATGTVRHLRLSEPLPNTSKASQELPDLVLQHGAAFGLTDPVTELRHVARHEDRLGWTHHTFEQMHRGTPVLGARLRTHRDGEGRLVGITAGLVAFPATSTADALVSAVEATAAARVFAETELETSNISATAERLVVLRGGLLHGRTGGVDHLAWEVSILRNGVHIEDIYIESARGTLVERVPRVTDLHRMIHHESYPNPVWNEGDDRPFTGLGAVTDAEVETLIETSGNVYSLFTNLSGGAFRSWDGAEAIMHNAANYQGDDLGCPNAQWTGRYTRYCSGMATDDVAAHEWTHAYTSSTHGLIYMWQSGALNEAYSDIFGETVDLIDGIGFDDPNGLRTPGLCSAFAGGETSLTVLEPADIAGDYLVGSAKFNPLPPWSMEGVVELVVDESGAHNGCGDLVGFTPGNIALIEFGACLFYDPVARAETAGASGAIVINTATDAILDMPGAGERLGIPSVLVRKSDGIEFKAAAEAGTLRVRSASAEGSTRWLMGEDTSMGVLRDMWVPGCAGDPASVDDELYHCDSSSDNGGVHVNSGVPNRAFTMLVDGGTVNGENVPGIGLTKASHIYWRAMSAYQIPISHFGDHADALEASCADLLGGPLTDLVTGEQIAETITSADCVALQGAIAAAALRAEVPCHFRSLLRPDQPTVNRPLLLLDETFANPAPQGWQFEDEGVFEEYEPRSWTWTEAPPEGTDGPAMYAASDPMVGNCVPGSDDQSGVVRLTTAAVEIPTGAIAPVLLFDHYVATVDYPYGDGGNVKISVNEAPFELIPASAFRFNSYTDELRGADDGSTNPLAGEPAFVGYNEGFFEGSWGQSQVDLAGLVNAGDTVRIRFDFGTDGCYSLDGWYLDRVQIVAAPTAREGSERVQ